MVYNKDKWEQIQTFERYLGTSMEARESVEFQPLPGSDALKTARLFDPHRPLPYKAMRRYFKEGAHRTYLENDAYDEYLHMDKVIVDDTGAETLIHIGETLQQQELPTYLDAAGWAFAEAGLASHELSTSERVGLVGDAESIWARGLVNSVNIGEKYGPEYQFGENEGHRTALNLAFAPLLKSIIIGNVREEVMHRTLLDVAEIGRDSRVSLDQAHERGDEQAIAFHRGFLFEASALMALLYMEDPRYVPLPATARGDTGYYHREQTHDISIINQHWGEIRKIIPVEIKSSPSRRANRRYKALVIPGRVRLSVSDAGSCDTADAFYDLANGIASTEQTLAIEQLSTQLREMLRLYQRGMSVEGVATGGLTRFYDSEKVAQVYPELSKDLRRRYRFDSPEPA